MKRLWKRWLCVTLTVGLLAVFPIHTLGEGGVMEWTYDNSIVVTIKTDTPQQFTPEDFPEINCKRVVTVYKHESDGTEGEKGILYSLVLVLKDSGDKAVEKALEAVQKNPRVTRTEKNFEYQQFKNWVKLNLSQHTLKVGETTNLQIADSAIEDYSYHKTGVFFIIDPAAIDDSNLSKSSFEQYGVFHFWPCNRQEEPYTDFGRPPVDNPTLEGCKSNANRYYAVADDDSLALEMADHLARENGIVSVWVDFNHDLVVGGIYSPEIYWEIKGTSGIIALSCSSSGKETAIIRGVKPGSVTVTLTVKNAKMQFSDSCTIRVVDEYQNGDINRDGDINASDALLALQHSVRLITLDAESQALADMDGNGEIDSADALKILQISVGLLS